MTAASSAYPRGRTVNFSDPRNFQAYLVAAVNDIIVQDSGGTGRSPDTTNFFTEMARRGLQDTTNWTSGTYKTLLSVSSGGGEVAMIIGPTSGSAVDTTFEITVDDGTPKEIVIPTTNATRAVLSAVPFVDTAAFVTTVVFANSGAETLNAGKTIFTPKSVSYIPPWGMRRLMFPDVLQFDRSILIRAKHGADITNSTATAYSAVMYRLFL